MSAKKTHNDVNVKKKIRLINSIDEFVQAMEGFCGSKYFKPAFNSMVRVGVAEEARAAARNFKESFE